MKVTPTPYEPVGADLGTLSGLMPAAIWSKLKPLANDDGVFVCTATFVEGYKHAMGKDSVEQLQAVVDQCLVERGYQRFRLSQHRMSVQRSLRQATPELQNDLRGLGSSEAVLTTQQI